MIGLTNANADVCVIGRTNFSTGIGAVSYAACELLSRFFSVSIYPTNSGVVSEDAIYLPNGRRIPVCRDLSKAKVYFYTDVLWNGEHDLHYTLVPRDGLRIAHIAYDSDELPAKWVEILNAAFDVAYFTSHHLEAVAIQSGVKIPVGTLPVGLETEPLLVRPFAQTRDKVVFGSVAAFHQRKGVDVLVEAFLQEFKDEEGVELYLHSNLAIGDVYNKIVEKIKHYEAGNVFISHENLSVAQKTELLEKFDIFVNCSKGEGYSIGPREALSLGKMLVLSDVGPHQDMFDCPGCYAIDTTLPSPARYPEIDNQIFGKQYGVSISDVRVKLREAYDFFKEGHAASTAMARRARAHHFSFDKLAIDYARVVSPDLTKFKSRARGSDFTKVSERCNRVAIERVGAFASKLTSVNRIVLPAHDGGFFSVFNCFMSHLAWDLPEDRCHMVLPDWDVTRLLEKQSNGKLVSFCYGTPRDGNIWLKLFEPLYGLSADAMNDEQFLYERSSLPQTIWNQHREPLLTYTHAYDLYSSASFQSFRRQYHKAFKDHVRLLPSFQKEIDDFGAEHFAGKVMLAAHVKHPSHIIEQPGACIAHGQAFVDAVLGQLDVLGISRDSEEWGVFLATDQDRVVAQFEAAFGDRVSYYDDVRRTRVSEDEYYDSLPEEEKAKEGFQVQHLVAANPDNWSTRMAWEVIRDAMTMARCGHLFHVVSNVSTAVSYMNPDVKLIFVDGSR
ncbi:glycosyltransferase [Pseudomonas asiatica]|uniref:Glycosyltransferase n=1 Tax=Pseudomonas asiatica TaxID=2219225 RepID=A0ABU5L140_9PSED|nr:glycosyltransferase [Pseudomonas asiatica]MDZ5739558.1 glycosyltransferase [Pseudomonas asiatica]MDZ5746380.1 glycosyltransferase [Pseudomonas asiatica]MDZ5751212.1 glycosyltransferase [Pseudomonas asiatica]MDZ5754071.1 glycosyltransferase [Pseudomonas asiatica]